MNEKGPQRPEGWLSRSHKQGRPWFRRTRLAYLRWRVQLDARPRTAQAYRITIGVLGSLIIVLGLILVPLPGPGWLIVLTGVAVIASEFEFARRLLRFARAKLRAWTHWVAASHWTVGTGLALITCACVVGAVWLVLLGIGLPTWVPRDWVPAWTGLR
ncbi:TIGR02611 family protein [Brevibacterium yomogidense]|uniref:TIGR02611 family protein n=1 Tax=Brevibacterium yomogidense TaxID=946573 RepID=UPI002FCD2305